MLYILFFNTYTYSEQPLLELQLPSQSQWVEAEMETGAGMSAEMGAGSHIGRVYDE